MYIYSNTTVASRLDGKVMGGSSDHSRVSRSSSYDRLVHLPFTVPPIRYNLFKVFDSVAVYECQQVIGSLNSSPLDVTIGEKSVLDLGVYLITNGALGQSFDCSVL